MSGAAKAAVLGGLLASVVVAGLIALAVFGPVRVPTLEATPSRVLVVGLAPDADGVDAAVIAVVLNSPELPSLIPDVDASVTVPGTSATSAREAYPYGGGNTVAQVLARQLGESSLEWIVLPTETWAALVDSAGGVVIDVPTGISVYRDGQLLVLKSGRVKLSGAEAVALASATEFMSPAERTRVISALQSMMLDLAEGADLLLLVRSGQAKSSVSAESLGQLLTAP